MHCKTVTSFPLFLISLFLFIFCLKNEGFASQSIQFTQERPFNITLAQTGSRSTVMVGPESVHSAKIKVEGDKNVQTIFSPESQNIRLRNSRNKKITINGLRLNPSEGRFNDQGLIFVYLGGQIHMKANQASGRYTGTVFIQGRYRNAADGNIRRFPVRLIINILTKINANVLRDLNFGQVISGVTQNQVRVLASESDTRAGCISINGEQGNNVKINYPAQVDLKHRSKKLTVAVSSSVDNRGKVLRLNSQGGGQICFGGLLTVPAHTVPGKYKGRVNVQLFYP